MATKERSKHLAMLAIMQTAERIRTEFRSHIRESIRETKSTLKRLQFGVSRQPSRYLERIICAVKNDPQKSLKLIKKLNIY